MTGILPAVVKPELEGGNLVLVVVVALIALGALGMAAMFRSQVLAAGEGTDNMRTIAQAVQEGANAYLTRQFRTLGIFAAVAFVVLFALPADDMAVRIGRSIFFLVGAGTYNIVIDLEAVEFLDSTGLGVLVGGLKKVRAHDGSLDLVCTQERLLKIFRITGLAKVFVIHDSVGLAPGA